MRTLYVFIFIAVTGGCTVRPQNIQISAEVLLNSPLSIRPTGLVNPNFRISSASNFFLKEPSGDITIPAEYDPSISSRTVGALGAGEIAASLVRSIVKKVATATVTPSSPKFIDTVQSMKSNLAEKALSLASSQLSNQLQVLSPTSKITIVQPSLQNSVYEYIWQQSFRYYRPEDSLDRNGFIVEFGFIELNTENGPFGPQGKVSMGIAIINPLTLLVIGRASVSNSFDITLSEDSLDYEAKVMADFETSIIQVIYELVNKVIQPS